MKIEAGKFYRTRDGRKARVYAVDGGGQYTIHGAVSQMEDEWMIGRWDFTGSNLSHGAYDLISEWVDKPQFDWSKAAAWHNFIVLTRSGGWLALRNRPTISRSGDAWVVEGGANYIDGDFSPTFPGDWKDSMIERPTA